ncbi:hypothetical protein HPB47_014243 [Ixodes persulcatus]|uniref:Uncharacterized protein n=1 Tax=Ixodes persulcatus TaxID=34615 RepID=A0AC60QXC1_IXOPE|nr:hypothetical protein HPB47_014243 [Ixodes persulcatus]
MLEGNQENTSAHRNGHTEAVKLDARPLPREGQERNREAIQASVTAEKRPERNMGPVHLLEQPHLIWGREMPVERTLCHDDNSNSEDCPEAAIDMSLASRPSPSPPSVGSSHHSKKSPQPIPAECKDEAYWERRKRNNESAKRSRELRRIKEQQTALRVLYLEQENLQLRTELTMLRSEVDKLRQLLFVGKHNNS